MVIAEEVALFGLRGKLQEVQLVCNDGSEGATTTIVEVVEQTCERVEAKCKNGTMTEKNTDMEAKIVKARFLKVQCASNSQGRSVE